MGVGFKDYFWECIGEAPNAFRRGMVVVTVLANIAVVATLLLGWHLNAFTALQLVSAAVVFALIEILAIFPYRLWKTNKAEIDLLRARLEPRLRCSFNMNDQGCVRPNTLVSLPDPTNAAMRTNVVFTWFRLRVEALGGMPINNCVGRLLSIKRGDAEMLAGETPMLPFAPAEEPDATSNVPEYLDLFAANQTDGVLLTLRGHVSQAVKWGDLFNYAGRYTIRIAIAHPNATPSITDLIFDWTLNPATSNIAALSQ